MSVQQRPEFLAARFLEAARGLDLPQEFSDYRTAEAFRELKGGAGAVRMSVRDGVYRVTDPDVPCGCPDDAVVHA
jgi:hypothetical protein